MKLNRRDFIMGSLALGGAAAVGGLAGCSAPKQTPSDQGAMPDTGAEKGIPEIFTDGKRIGTAMGHDDELIAGVVVANGDLASIRVLRCDRHHWHRHDGGPHDGGANPRSEKSRR